jgi:hypothetical protein
MSPTQMRVKLSVEIEIQTVRIAMPVMWNDAATGVRSVSGMECATTVNGLIRAGFAVASLVTRMTMESAVVRGKSVKMPGIFA